MVATVQAYQALTQQLCREAQAGSISPASAWASWLKQQRRQLRDQTLWSWCARHAKPAQQPQNSQLAAHALQPCRLLKLSGSTAAQESGPSCWRCASLPSFLCPHKQSAGVARLWFRQDAKGHAAGIDGGHARAGALAISTGPPHARSGQGPTSAGCCGAACCSAGSHAPGEHASDR